MSSIVNVVAQSAVSKEKCEKKTAIKESTSRAEDVTASSSQHTGAQSSRSPVLHPVCGCCHASLFSPSILVSYQKWGHIIMLQIKKKIYYFFFFLMI